MTHYSTVDLPEEILLIIMSKISNVYVLHSFVGTSVKLDRLARDFVHTRSIDLTEKTSNEEIRPLSDEILDRFCDDIFPEIHQNIESITVESSLIHRIFQWIDYPNLFSPKSISILSRHISMVNILIFIFNSIDAFS